MSLHFTYRITKSVNRDPTNLRFIWINCFTTTVWCCEGVVIIKYHLLEGFTAMPETVNEMAIPIPSRRAYISGLSTKVGGKQISQKKHQQNNLKKKKKNCLFCSIKKIIILI